MVQFIMNLDSYKRFFKKDTTVKDKEAVVYLNVEGIENKDDKEWNFSIKWTNEENEENGKIYGINTSSIFAFNSCSWMVEDP